MAERRRREFANTCGESMNALEEVLQTSPANPVSEFAPEKERSGIGLALSGGGYRATLFHLGACRRLNELGILGKLYSISSVSGGSIFAAFLSSLPWDRVDPHRTPSFDQQIWDDLVAGPVRRLCQTDIRTEPILKKLMPWRWGRPQAVELLAETLEPHIGARGLKDLPKAPRFIFCATNLGFGVNWVFERTRMGDYQMGYLLADDGERLEWPLSLAVAISACFPPVFNAYRFTTTGKTFQNGLASDIDRARVGKNLRLNDGGNYDNLGLEPLWKRRKYILVSDGGGVFEYLPDSGLFWRLLRYVSVLDAQARALRRRWLVSSFEEGRLEGTYWGIGSAAKRYEQTRQGEYSYDNAQRYIAKIRTDLDAFSETEMGILENHGYTLADVAVSRYLANKLEVPNIPFLLPFPKYTDDKLSELLKCSNTQRVFGRGWRLL